MAYQRLRANDRVRGASRVSRALRAPERTRQSAIAPRSESSLTFWLAIVAVLALAVTALLGTLAALAFIVVALLMIAAEPRQAATAIMRFSPLLLIALLAMASTLWSDSPQRTLRAAIQLLLTMTAAILVAQRLEARTLIATLFCGIAATCLPAIPFVPDAVKTGSPLFQPFESKNMLGFAAHLMFALGLAVTADRDHRGWLRLAALASLPFALLLVWLTRSAGAQLAVAITIMVFLPLLMMRRLPPAWRIGVVILGLALVGIAAANQPQIEALITTIRGDVLNKNATLTGRTYLWEFAGRVAEERPLFGHGFYAFWRQGNIDAEGLWRWGGIASRTGFNFHNAFVEMRVDLGIVGQLLLAASCVGIGVASLINFLRQPSVSYAFFIGLLIVFYVRAFGESILVAPFGVSTALWIAAGVYAAGIRRAEAIPAGEAVPRRGWLPNRVARQPRPSRSTG